MSDREGILNRIRLGLASGHEQKTGTLRDKAPALETSTATVISKRSDLVKIFKEECEAQAMDFHEALDPGEAGRILVEIFKQLHVDRVFACTDPILRLPELDSQICASDVVDLTPRTDPSDRDTLFALAARADVGVTGVDYALADTGTLVLFSSPDRTRSASLLPPVHIALLYDSQILAGLDDLVPLLPEDPQTAMQRESNITFITGTSKTADIELSLVRGVHGPGTVHVIVLHGALPEEDVAERDG